MKNKKLISLIAISIALLMIMVGCSGKKENQSVNTDIADGNLEDNELQEDEEVGEDVKVMEEFKEITKDLPTPEVLIDFMDDNIDKVNPIYGDEMINSLEVSLEENKNEYEEELSKIDKDNELMEIAGDKAYFEKSHIDEIENKELKEKVEDLYSKMYKLENIEGSFYPIIDYSKLKTYDSYITEEWKDYLAVKTMDSEDRPMSDGELNISFDELADRILKTENYLNKYVDGQRQKEMIKNYEYKINAYLKGLANTNIADKSTKKIKDEVLKSYKDISDTQNYMTSHTVYEYLEAIKENDYIIDENIVDKADELIEEAIRMLREFK
jgi:hypothetical protein